MMNRVYSAGYYEEYYKTGNGTIYSDKEKWYPFFDAIAEKLIKNYHPDTVLDVGCAYGYLVEALRKKGVEAYGIDVSEYAIGNAAESIRPYVRVNSAADSLPNDFPSHFDLITSIEVLEHLTVEEGEKALGQLCRLTDIFVFSSTDSDLEDVTHINVQRKEYWARIFAKHGFFRDVQSSTDYISEAADVYRRRTDLHNVIQEYEVVLRTERQGNRKRKADALIYYDTGKGLNDEEKFIVPYEIGNNGEFFISLELPEQVRQFRYDPAHVPCVLSGVEAVSGKRALAAVPLGAEVYANVWFFDTNGPQVLIQADGLTKIQVRGRLYFMEDEQCILYQAQRESYSKLLYRSEQDKKEFELRLLELRGKLEQLLSEKEKLQEKIDALKEAYAKSLHKKELEIERAESEGKSAQEKTARESEKKLQEAERQFAELLHEKELQITKACSEKESIQRQLEDLTDAYKKLQEAEKRQIRLLRENTEQLHEKELQIVKAGFEKESIQNQLKKISDVYEKLQESENCHIELLHEKEEQLKAVCAEKDGVQNKWQELTNAYAELSRQCEFLTRELAVSRETCAVYEKAFFWKITKPARAAVDGIRQTGAKARGALSGIKTGVKRLGSKGWTGIKSVKEAAVKPVKKVTEWMNKKSNFQIYEASFQIPEEERKKQEGTIFCNDITFSILVPLYNTPINFLSEMIDSVVKQTYPKWELCLADGSDAEHKEVRGYCRKIARKDRRIKYKKLKQNGGISENTNACIDMATGEYIGLFDHDDLLYPTALYEMMCVIEKENADFLYTDEAVFEGDIGNITTMHFKPDYGIDTLRANNYICHFSVFQKSLLEKAGKFRSEYDGSQDHDMVLRLTRNASKVCHIPKMLYYWRSHPASVASDVKAKPYVGEAGRKAVQASIEACGERAVVENSDFFPAIYRVRYEIEGNPMISIIIQCQDCHEETARCVTSIFEKSTYKNYEIILVDDNSRDHATFEYYRSVLKKHKKRLHILNWRKAYNYAALNNYAVQHANGSYILLLHNDTAVISPDWMEELLMYAQRKDVGAVGAKLYYENDTVRHAGMILGMGEEGIAGYIYAGLPRDNFGYMGRLYYAQNMSMVSSACLLVKKEIYQNVGGFEETYHRRYSDADFCMKVRKAGYVNVFNPYAELYHFKLQTAASSTPIKDREDGAEEDIAYFRDRWKEELQKGDPYFNPHFDLSRTDLTVKNL